MNIYSYRETEPWNGRSRLYVTVPIPEDYTQEEKAYVQSELVRVTYLSMYKIIDKIGLDRENESQRLREAEQEKARREAGSQGTQGCGCGPEWCGYPTCAAGPAEEAPQAPDTQAQACPGCGVICRRCE